MTPQEALPTEPGWYLDRDGDVWHLPNPHEADQTRDKYEFGDFEDREYSPFRRLYTLRDAAAVISDRFLGSDLVFDSDHDNAIVAARLLEIAEEG